jgi:flagellar biosynthesis/type III secretory pathway chaperone
MNQHPQAKQPPDRRPPIETPADARKLAEEMLDVMSKLIGVVEQETELVRAGKVREAMQLEQQKSALSGRYVTAIETLRAAQEHLALVAPDLLASLKRHHETFRAMLQINLTVLATAHAVSEGILRGVNAEVQRRNTPNTYTAAGQRAAPGPRHITPLAVSRSL